MTDFTPTTAGVREAYVSQVLARTEETDAEVPGAEFDRWLASVLTTMEET